MLWLIKSKSCCEADHTDGLLEKPGDGGGPESLNGSGAVDNNFEFPAEKSIAARFGEYSVVVVAMF